MRKDEFLRSFEDALHLDAGSLSGSEALDSLAEWDSLAILEYISLVHQQTGRNVLADDVRGATTVDDLYQLAEGSPA